MLTESGLKVVLKICVSLTGLLTFVDGGGVHEGVFESSQLVRRGNSQVAVQRAQAAAAKARTLAM